MTSDAKVRMPQSGTALAHPLFWTSLVVLLVNDRVLKQTGLFPGAITGKLSDFAGLLVAPTVLAIALRARGRIARMAVFASVAAVFTAIKVSRPAADVLEAISAYSPFPWRLWCDPTDLVALAVLPLAWWLVERGDTWIVGIRLAACLRAAGLLVGIFACAGTSSVDEWYLGTAFLQNGTMRTQTLRLYRLQRPLDCNRLIEDPVTWPGRDAFGLEACWPLRTREILPLDQGWKNLGKRDISEDDFNVVQDAGFQGPGCDAVLLEADGLSPQVVTWNGVRAIVFTGAELFGESAKDDHGLILEQAGERLFIKGTSLLRVLPAGFGPLHADCPNGER